YLASTATKTDVAGRLYLCADLDRNVDARVLGFDENAGLQVVVGESALQCATKGSVESAHCTLDYSGSEQVIFKLDQSRSIDTSGLGYSGTATMETPVLVSGGDTEKTWYLVGPKYDLGSGTPGEYKALAAATPPAQGTCKIIP